MVVGLLVSRYVVDSNKSVCLILCLSYCRLLLIFFTSFLPCLYTQVVSPFHALRASLVWLCNVANSTTSTSTSTTFFSPQLSILSSSSPLLYFLLQRTKKVIRVLVVSFPSVSSTGLGCCKQTKQKNKNVKMLPCLCSSLPYTPQRGISQYATVETPCFQVCC